MSMILLHNAVLVTGHKIGKGAILIDDGKISKVIWEDESPLTSSGFESAEKIDLCGKHIIAGGIDAHVHFREPGLTHKADISSESRAAAAGGVTTVFDMPNTIPPTTGAKELAEKKELAKGKSIINIGFHIGASNSNAEDICKLLEGSGNEYGIVPQDIPGVKVFMGSSTGNMLVDDDAAIKRLFSIRTNPVLVHCEDEMTIRSNLTDAIDRFGEDIPFREHENIRSRQACIRSSIKALESAMKYGTRLVLCHISTEEEMNMVTAAKNLNPGIIAETSCNYLWFSNNDYDRLGSRLKCNPSVKTDRDRKALREGLGNGAIDTIGSDHAPHLLSEKDAPYTKAPSGLPSIQQTLPVLVTIAREEDIPLTRIASVFSEKASELYSLDRGVIKEGYQADLVVFDPEASFKVKNSDQYSKCGWTPYDGEELYGHIEMVFVKGKPIYENGRML